MANLTMNAPILSTVLDHEKAIHAITGVYGYYDRHWMPQLRGASGKVIKALLKHISFNPATWTKAGLAIPKYDTIARDAGVSHATVTRVLHRVLTEDEASELSAKYGTEIQVGDFAYGYQGRWLGDLIQRFVRRIENRWRFDKLRCHSVQTSNHYDLAHILPPIPQHDELVRLKAIELAQREIAQAEAGPVEQNEPHYGGSKRATSQGIKTRHKIEVLESSAKEGVIRSTSRGEGPMAIGNGSGHQERGRTDQDEGQGSEDVKSYRKQSVNGTNAPAAPPRPPETEEERRDRDDALHVACYLETQLGSKMPETVANALVKEMEVTQVPYGIMVDVFYHAKARMWRDGHPVDPARYYPTVVRGVIAEVQRAGWNLDRVISQDKTRWAKADLRAKGQQMPPRRDECGGRMPGQPKTLADIPSRSQWH